MAAYLESGFSVERLSEEMNAAGSAFYLAKEHNRIIGYLKINFGDRQTELKDEKAMEIERIYVLKAFHGQHVGQLIFEFALQLAINNHCNYVWLGVWEENPRAIRFYEKNGFVGFDKHVFKLGDDEQTDIMMRLELQAS
jgi:ribosomal protein S18 acetylase RimI-like enzyme